MTFEEIYVGERNRSMGVLSTSIDTNISSTIASRLDLPGQKPNGYDLKSYTFGMQESGYYIFARISPDHTAERGGMVFGHALAIPIENLSELSDLKPVFSHLHATRPANPVAQTRSLQTNGVLEALPPGAICDVLVDAGLRPAVTTQADWVEDWVIRIWPKLTTTMRQELRFGLIFSAEDSVALGLHLAVVPQRALAQWKPDSCFQTKDAAEAPAKTSQGVALTSDNGTHFQSLATELGLTNVGFAKFNRLSKTAEFFDQENNFQKALAAIRLVGSLQPDLRHGQSVRTTLSERIFENPGPSSGKDCLALRNLKIELLGKTPELSQRLEVAIGSGLTRNTQKASLRECIEAAYTEGQATPEWSQAVKKTVRTTETLKKPVTETLFSLAVEDAQILEEALRDLSATNFDSNLMSKILESGQSIPVDARKILAKCNFYQSEAVALKAEHNGDLEAALKAACERSIEDYGRYAIEYLLIDMNPTAIVAAAMTFSQIEIRDAATECVVKYPKILTKWLAENPQALDLWEVALKRSGNSWAINDEKEDVQTQILEMHTLSPLPANLIKLLMESPVGDWSRHSRRHDVWDKISGPTLHTALRATARGWLTDFTNGTINGTSSKLESPLIEKLTSHALRQELILALTSQPISKTLELLMANGLFPGEILYGSLKQRFDLREVLTPSDSQRLGHLLVTRDWKPLTREIYKKYGQKHGLRPALHIAANHLSFLSRMILGFSEETLEQLLEPLIEISTELYPTGVRDKDIWARAGGNIADLHVNREGKRQWREAISMMWNGGTGPTADELVNSMLLDYPTNTQLLYMKKALAK